MPIYVKEVEEKKLKEFETVYKDNPNGIKKAMQFIMDETKRIEDLRIDYDNYLFPVSLLKPVKLYKTGAENLVDIIESSARELMVLLKNKNGRDYSLKRGREGNLYTVSVYEI